MDLSAIISSFINRYFIILFLDATILILMSKNKELRDSRVRSSLYALMILTLLLSIFRVVDTEIEMSSVISSTPFARKFSSWFCYSFGPASLLAFFSMSTRCPSKYMHWLSTPLILNAALYSTIFFQTNVENPLVYSFSGINMFNRGTLGYFSHFLTVAYIIIFISYEVWQNNRKRTEDVPVLISCAIGCSLAMICESLDLTRDALYPCILTSGLVYYLYLYMQIGRMDSLTGLFNRQMYFIDMENFESKISGIIILDMNGLKTLNDGSGHSAGDTGLKTLAHIMERCVPSNASVYRIGGDEFAILCFSMDEAQIQQICNKIESEQQKTKYSMSIGYAFREQFEDLSQLQKTADAHMYQQKALYYRRSGIDRRGR